MTQFCSPISNFRWVKGAWESESEEGSSLIFSTLHCLLACNLRPLKHEWRVCLRRHQTHVPWLEILHSCVADMSWLRLQCALDCKKKHWSYAMLLLDGSGELAPAPAASGAANLEDGVPSQLWEQPPRDHHLCLPWCNLLWGGVWRALRDGEEVPDGND